MLDAIPFTKMQGVGNDFVVVEQKRVGPQNWPALALQMCSRHSGAGADGLLVIMRSSVADVRMRMFNPDGTEDMCGNGLRCVARYAAEHLLVLSDVMQVETIAGIRQATVHRDNSGAVNSISVEMGEPNFQPSAIPALVDSDTIINFPLELEPDIFFPVTVLSTGSAHAVTFVEVLPDDETFLSVSPLVESHPLFPERVSLMWCQITGENSIRIRIWERGAGETMGCGTGACAAAVAAIYDNRVLKNTPIEVTSPGGVLEISWNTRDEVIMRGPAETVYSACYYLT